MTKWLAFLYVEQTFPHPCLIEQTSLEKFITRLELSSISKMQTRDKAEEKRDLELENIVGNLLIAEYQVDRLRSRLADVVSGYRPQLMKNNASTHVFKHNNKWYKLSLRIEETDISPGKDSTEQR
jgi:hypothetical protein